MKTERVRLRDGIVVSDGERMLKVEVSERAELWLFINSGDGRLVARSIEEATALRDMLIAAISDYETKGARS